MRPDLRRKAVEWLVLPTLSVLVALVVAEVVLRTFFPVYPVGILRSYQYDPELGVRVRPGVHLFETTDLQQEIRSNRLGTINFQESFEGYEQLIFAVGDSYTQGTGLPADLSYPAQLDLLINQDSLGFYRKKYGVVNLGLSAYGGEQELIALRRWAGALGTPDVILYLGCDNDAADDVRFRSGQRHQHLVSGNPTWGRLTPVLQWLTNDLQLGMRLKLLRGQLRQPGRRASALPGVNRTPDSLSVARRQRPVLERLAAYAQEQQALLIVSWSDNGNSYRWLKGWAAARGIPFADWVPRYASVKAAIPALPKTNPHSAGHHRGWVNRVIAEEYARQLPGAR